MDAAQIRHWLWNTDFGLVRARRSKKEEELVRATATEAERTLSEDVVKVV